ncbi:valine--tRNA ligase, mitochondrial isoform X1 [Platichthys flesus]|uniref:valine--tRNA ligase, mitochondrial isoform X1 n=1 Tax=Platichthys flesus TaxID=8260 RepID=UPI002DBA45F3|nr:valine--tRNA ligase, mitochondrial isoform X1 [Platichthys flesus]XP_062265345.1 valine--tRNA ligase, mitochondrial isoform X1 [Platichthys flesus]XP_062265346.1 valine--tRNA ligase, mitochondrial isoform X1 [Platichthys flesus]
MWRTGGVLRVRVLSRGAARLCSSNPSNTSSSSSSKSISPPRFQAEKQRRRREREQTILSSQHSSAEDKPVKWTEKQRILYTATTPPGTKKDTSLPFPTSYSPEYVESSWYQWWEKEGFFSPEQHERLPQAVDRTFSLCIPPPNVTGTLHLGHALTVAVQDALVRRRRMQGYRVLWVPGCDHAGIATQTVVERRLLREEGKHRHNFTRDEFLQEVWKWKNDKGEEIYKQLRSLGASLDWSRACFTMDPGFSRAVTEAFVRLCDVGLIYRSEGLVNWSCALESAISDIEVDSKELSGPTMLSVPGYENKVEFGTMFTFAYPIDDHDGEVMVSTTRPETMLGDVAVAVHPDDPRYQAVNGKQCRHPFTNRLLPIITDSMVDMELGTGAVKVTPAHDHSDFLLSQRHSLPRLTVIRGDGTMTPPCGQWLEGVKRFDARQFVVDALVERKLFRGKKSHAMTLPICSRSGDIIEPLLKKQWFVRCDQMAKKALQAVEDGQLQIIPDYYNKTWKTWLSSISDWCISRQLWWGHQIPAYQVELPNCTDTKEERWVWGQSEDEARQRAAIRYGVRPEAITLTQDPDVLDTWFSSGLFPFAMLGWPEQTTDLLHYYPISILETGNDLVFFWVARMVMLGTELTGQLPFKQVLFHSLVRDKHGRKMSKSLGNVIDPLDVIHGVSLERLQEKVMEGNLDHREQLVAIEAQRKDFPKGIPQCGTDALRFALCSHKMQGEDISLSVSQVLSCRHFCNKMWQTLRFTLGVLGHTTAPLASLEETTPLSSMDQWICSRLYITVLKCEQAFEAYELHTVTSALYSFWVHSLCDVYMEHVKHVLAHDEGAMVQPNTEGSDSMRHVATSVLYHCVSVSLALLSPFMPFITEELWQRLQPFRHGAASQTSLSLQPYPCSSQLAHWHFPEVESAFLLIQEVIRTARSLRAQCGMTKDKPAMWAVCTPSQAQVLLHFGSAVWTLSRTSCLHIYCPQGSDNLHSTPPPEGSLIGVVKHSCQLHLDIQSGVNVEKQILQLSQRRDKLVPKLKEILCKVQSPNFLTKVPAHVRQKMDHKMSTLQQELKTIEDHLKMLQENQTTAGNQN